MKQIINENADGSVLEAPYWELCEKGMFERKNAKLTIKWRNDLSKNSQIMILKKALSNIE